MSGPSPGDSDLSSTLTRINTVLATAGEGGAHQGLELALRAAARAGVEAITASRGLPPREQLLAALQAAAEALEGVGQALAAGKTAAE
jgi:hypothetical protein